MPQPSGDFEVAMKQLLGSILMWGALNSGLADYARAEVSEDGNVARIKAVYLYHFATFAEWPQTLAAEREVRLCMMGGGEVVGQLPRLDGRDLGDGRILRVVPLRRGEAPRGCHIVFIGAAAGELATVKIEFSPPYGLGTLSLASGSGIQRPSTTRQYS